LDQNSQKIRVYALARELNVDTKELMDLARANGIDVKNQLSNLEPDQRDALEQIVRKGGGVALAAPPKPAEAPRPAPVMGKVRTLTTARPPVPRAPAAPAPEPARSPVSAPPPPTVQPAPVVTTPPVRAPERPALPSQPATPAEPQPVPRPAAQTPAPPRTVESPPLAPAAAAPPGLDSGTRPAAAAGPTAPAPPSGAGKVPVLGGTRPDVGQRQRRERPVPRVGYRVATPPPLRQKPVEPKKPPQPVAQTPIMELPKDVIQGRKPVNIQNILASQQVRGLRAPAPEEIEDEESGASGKKKSGGSGVAGRGERHAKRSERAQARKTQEAGVVDGRLVLTEDDTPRLRVKDRVRKLRQKPSGPTQPRKGKVPIELPITVRSLSEAIGVKEPDLMFKLRDQGIEVTRNSTLEPTVAEAVALEYNCELNVKRPQDAEEQLLAAYQHPDKPEELAPRAPVVTIMGHVDHGKTSILDKVRKSNVVATEAGGITQVIRAWRVEHNGKPITFLDTPGHEAFTKMRARGANVTDIAVIVVAADDGVMPQTEEAINHAKAAGVSMVVAINKVDLPNANIGRTRQMLYGLGVLPDDMGGDTPFVETSATTGKGIFDDGGLLDQISVVAELKDLRANPNRPASGTVLEAMLDEGEGVLATLLVQKGTLHQGDVVLCGASYGRVRAMYDDLGRPIEKAGPSVPVRITGLDVVPNADDPFVVVPDLATAREIAEKRKAKQQEASLVRREPITLENLAASQIAELKVILKADFRGSVEAIRKELEKLKHEEVRVRILEAAIGGITENDVWLALTSPQDTLILGFNVVPDERARTLAEERGVQIRQYNIIYNLTNDVRAALEGKLKPREEVHHLGRALVRQTFKISRVGTVAGCSVTRGVIERSAKVRVIRDGVVVYPPADRTVGLDSLKRVKEDVREVREGFECGIKITGYDDVKVGDVIEAFRVEQVQRTLESSDK
jgi:translation initiation factor IF-2